MWKVFVFRFARLIVARFPRKMSYFMASAMACVAYVSSPGMRAAVGDNLRHVLGPEADRATLRRTTRRVIRNTAKNYVDLLRIPGLKLEEIERSVTIHGWSRVEDAMKGGKGVLMVTAHLGSFDMAAQMLAVHKVKATILVESLEPPALFRYVARLRESNGLTLVPVRPGVARTAIQALRRGEMVLIATDRDVQGDGVEHKFFGEETTMPVGAVLLAMRAGAVVLPVFNIRSGNERYETFIEPPVAVTTKNALDEGIDQVVACMEKYIRRYPEQWVVLRRVWGNGG